MSQAAVAKLQSSGIDPQAGADAGLYPIDNARLVHIGFARVPALVIPYIDPWSGEPMTYGPDKRQFVRVRYLAEVLNQDNKVVRYAQPKDSGVHAYFPPGVPWGQVLSDPANPLVITEGELKALSMTPLNVSTIGLGGVYNFRMDDKLLPELERIVWKGRVVIVAYDSDAVDNPNIRHAELTICAELQRRGADVRIARLEQGLDGKKRGLDDYVVAGLGAELIHILQMAEPVKTAELDVMNLNKEIAYIEDEDCIYVPEDNLKISKSSFLSGSRYSALETAVVRTVKGKAHVTKQKLAQVWLTHPGARRYAGTVFDPGSAAREVATPRGVLLNKWRGFDAMEGPVQEFLDLTDYLFSVCEPGVKELVLKMFAYKAQNPHVKIPLAVVMIGPQGCGKSMWARLLGTAFAPYYYAVPSAALKAQFQPFLEASLVVVIDEAQAVHVEGARDKLKNLISESKQELNKKHVSQYQIDTYCQFILTSNDRRVGAFERDDRRHIVVDCPVKREDSFYDKLGAWERGGGPRRLIHWLTHVDLQGWKPPKTAPMTSEKHMAYVENLKPVQRLAEEMQTADYNVVAMWIEAAMAWGRVAQTGGNAQDAARGREIETSLGSVQIRPFYTPEELAMMFPAIVAQLHGNRKMEGTPAGEISSQLRNAGIRYLKCLDNPAGFRWRGRLCQFLIIANAPELENGLTQAQFETLLPTYPTFGAARGLQATAKRA